MSAHPFNHRRAADVAPSPLTPEQEAAIRAIVREETERERAFLAAIKRAVLQLAGWIQADPKR